MISDGEISDKENEVLMDFSKRLAIEKAYAKKLIEYYVKLQNQRVLNLRIFQNLFIMAAADGKIDEGESELLYKAAEALNISTSDFAYVHQILV